MTFFIRSDSDCKISERAGAELVRKWIDRKADWKAHRHAGW